MVSVQWQVSLYLWSASFLINFGRLVMYRSCLSHSHTLLRSPKSVIRRETSWPTSGRHFVSLPARAMTPGTSDRLFTLQTSLPTSQAIVRLRLYDCEGLCVTLGVSPTNQRSKRLDKWPPIRSCLLMRLRNSTADWRSNHCSIKLIPVSVHSQTRIALRQTRIN
jgi:hypothetical protein